MRAPAVRRALVAAGALAVVGGLVIVGSTPMTDASWSDREYARASFTALKVPAPTASACATRNGALGINRVTLNWRVPAGVTGYSSSTVEYGQKTNQGTYSTIPTNTLSTIATTGDATAYVTQVAGTSLGGALGDKKTFGLRFSGPGGWKSDWVDACTFDVVRSRILSSQVTATASSEEPAGGTYGLASMMTDDDAAAYWHSRWLSAPVGRLPYTLNFDTGKSQSINGLSQLTRSNIEGPIKDFQILTSVDGQTYTPVASGAWQNITTWQDVNFSAVTARYVRVIATSTVSGTNTGAVREIVIFGTPVP